MIEISHIQAGYGKTAILHDVSLSFNPGTLSLILGKNGSGKSTLLKALTREIPLQSGIISIDGEQTTTLTAKELACRIAYLEQQTGSPDISVERLLLHGRFPHLAFAERYRKEDYAIVDQVITRTDLERVRRRMVKTLSGGERQKVYIAMKLVQDTPYLVLDEPFNGLDITARFSLWALLETLKSQGKGIIIVLHDLGEALSYGESFSVLSKGKVRFHGSREELLRAHILESEYQIQVMEIEKGENRFTLFSPLDPQ